MREKLLKIINNYGTRNQLKYLYTELYEFTEAIIEYEEDENGNIRTQLNHIQEEIADLMVMLEQFKAYYNLSNEDVLETMEYKIERQLKRIEEENKR